MFLVFFSETFFKKNYSINSVYGTYLFINKNIELKLFYQTQCLKNFYGKNCTNFCVPKIYTNGSHFDCSQFDGNLICQNDWYGKNCNFGKF